MRTTVLRGIFLLLSAGASSTAGNAGPAASPPAGISCPTDVTVHEQATGPAGWAVSFATTAHHLESVTFFEGPPTEQASLVYDEQVKDAKEVRAIWRFTGGARGNWIGCGYSSTGTILSRQLPASVRTCTVAYERAASSASGLPAIRRIDCK